MEAAPGAPVVGSVHWPGQKIQYMRLFGNWLLCSDKTEMPLFEIFIDIHCPVFLQPHITHLLQNKQRPWFVVDDPAATQFSLQSSVLQMQASTSYHKKAI